MRRSVALPSQTPSSIAWCTMLIASNSQARACEKPGEPISISPPLDPAPFHKHHPHDTAEMTSPLSGFRLECPSGFRLE